VYDKPFFEKFNLNFMQSRDYIGLLETIDFVCISYLPKRTICPSCPIPLNL
jgi:hypothetical protein